MKMITARQILHLATGLLLCVLLMLIPACSAFGDETGTCSITCFSKSTGNNLGTDVRENYTRKECDQALENRQTILTECTLSWE